MKANHLSFNGLDPFDLSIRYIDDEVEDIDHQLGHHIHPECEIYLNISGDVSFMVENHLYPIKPGNIIITRPYEYHHCIYHSRTKHRHFWILFSPERNEKLLSLFFGRCTGSDNLFELGEEQTRELIALCHKMCAPTHDEIEKYFYFFKLLLLLESPRVIEKEHSAVQKELAPILEFIHQNFSEKLTVCRLAKEAHVSINTLERWFDTNIKMSPSLYIKKVRLANAARLLAEQASVTEAAEKSGFSDVSGMILQFKESYGITPLQYKKKVYAQKNR